MNSYLQTLKNLQIDNTHSQVLHQASKYNNYEDFLHRRSNLRHKTNQSYIYERITVPKSYDAAQPQTLYKNKSETVYYPFHRTEVEYHDRSYVEKVPKTKKVVEYIEKKEVEIVPKQVLKTDYFAVQHLRAYYKQVVPQVKLEMIQVPKKVKNTVYIPKERQIIFYPSHLTDIKQIKEQAKVFLEKQGVIIKQDAQFKPLATKITSAQVNSNLTEKLKAKIEQAEQRLEKLQRVQMQEIGRTAARPYYELARPHHHSKQFRNSQFRNSHSRSPKRVSAGTIPIYQKQKYQSNISKSHLSIVNNSSAFQEGIDSSFAQKDLYRYNLAVNSSIRSKY